MGNFRKSLIIVLISLLAALQFPFQAKGGVQFVANKGQWEDHILYKANLPDGAMFVEADGLTFSILEEGIFEKLNHHPYKPRTFDGHAFKIHFDEDDEVKASSHKGQNPYEKYVNYFRGNDRDKWASEVPVYEKVLLEDVKPGLDIELIGKGDFIKYNLILENPSLIDDLELYYEGLEGLALKGDEHLRLETSLRDFEEKMPLVYQPYEEEKEALEASYKVDENRVSFEIEEEIDHKQSLVIDPQLIFSSYSGSTADNFGYTATHDQDDNGYAAGAAFNTGFPTTTGAFQETYQGGSSSGVTNNTEGLERDVGILKFSDDGTSLQYATYLGGSDGNEDPHSIIVNSKNQLVVYGTTYADNHPVTPNAFDTSFSGVVDIFLTVLEEDGTGLVASTYLGGDGRDGRNGTYWVSPQDHEIPTSELYYNYGDIFRGEVMVDDEDNILVAGMTGSDNFPIPGDAFISSYPGGDHSGVAFSMDSSLASMNWGTFLGGEGHDGLFGIRVDDYGDVYVTGGTSSSDFPVTQNAYQTSFQGNPTDGVLAKLQGDGQALLSSTFVGTSEYDVSYLMDIGADDDIWITGQTEGDFPLPHRDSVYSDSSAGQFIARFDTDLSTIENALTFGYEDEDPIISPSAFMVDNCGRVFLSGWGGTHPTTSGAGEDIRSLPVTPNAEQTALDINSTAFYLTVFSHDLSNQVYGTFFGGDQSNDHVDGGTSRFDEEGRIYQAVCASCGGRNADFPTTSDAYSTTNNSANCNNALFKMEMIPSPPIEAKFEVPDEVCLGDTFSVENLADGEFDLHWDFDNGQTSDENNPEITYQDTGSYTIQLVASDFVWGCADSDTMEKTIYVKAHAHAEFDFETESCDNRVHFSNDSSIGEEFTWRLNEDTLTGDSVAYDFPQDSTYPVQLRAGGEFFCADSTQKDAEPGPFVKADWETESKECSRTFDAAFTGHYNEGLAWNVEDSIMVGEQWSFTFPDSGKYSVDVFMDTQGPCPDTSSFELEVDVLPLADFEYESFECKGEVDFKFTGHYADSLTWIFGDHDTVTHQQELTHHFTDSGQFEVTLIAEDSNQCSDTISRDVVVNPFVEPEWEVTVDECSHEAEFEFTGNYNQGLNWKTDDTLLQGEKFTYEYPLHGIYEVELFMDTEGPCPDNASFEVRSDTVAHADFEFDARPCQGEVSFEFTGLKAEELTWHIDEFDTLKSQEAFSHTFTDTGTYQVHSIAEDQNGCRDTLNKEVFIDNIVEMDFDYEQLTCRNEYRMVNRSEGGDVYSWSINGDTVAGDLDTITHQFSESGPQEVTIASLAGDLCETDTTQTINVDSFPQAQFSSEKQYCPYDYQFSAEGSEETDFLWLESGKKFTENREFIRDLTGMDEVEMTLIAFPDSACADTTTQTVTVEPNPEADFNTQVEPCDGILTTNNNSIYAEDFVWNFNDDTLINDREIRELELQQKGGYHLTLIAGPDRKCPDSLRLEDEWQPSTKENIEVPNVFSPTGDGKNEVLQIQNIEEECDDYEWVIYNRWGEEVIRRKEAPFKWDGYVNGEPIEAGTYYYIFRASDWEKKGNISLFR